MFWKLSRPFWGKIWNGWCSNFYWCHQELNCWYEPRYSRANDWYQSKSHENSNATEWMPEVAHCNQLITIVFYIKNEEVLENILFFQPLKTTKWVQHVFDLIKENFLKHGLLLALFVRMMFLLCLEISLDSQPTCKRKFLKYMSHIACGIGSENLLKNLQDILSACVKT